MEILIRILAFLGGTTVVLGAVALFSSNIIRDWLKQRWKKENDLEIEKIREQGTVAQVQPLHYMADQYDVYVKLWGALVHLQDAVDALWESASADNCVSLAEQLREIKPLIQQWSLFFEEDHITQFKETFRILERFHAGKLHLYELRQASDLQYYSPEHIRDDIEEQVIKNQHEKERFEELLKVILAGFKLKLSGHPEQSRALDRY